MIEIIEVRPPWRPADACVFDAQIGPNLRLYNLAMRRLPNGFARILAPNAYGKHSATFAPPLAAEILKALEAAMGGAQAYENDRAAA
ncbi:hypothetical protein HFO42_20185 [Rhizobium leguminosarum]|uniref:Uncharacterized protein n=1 Tax=Rhizobium leguminosarum TaxID=384 RepID=A0AAJ1AB03_RHILE|nr:hypothetical protein [Rhizobium leguminosarum]MBY5630410.1 hypothetical protein [Rhizobium leguminosarum]